MKKCCCKRLWPSLICISLIPAPAVFGQDTFSVNTDDYNHAKEVNARRARTKQQILQDQKEAEENQDRNFEAATKGQVPPTRRRRQSPNFASENKGGYVQDNRRARFDPTGGQPHPLKTELGQPHKAGIEDKFFPPPSIPVPNYGKPVMVPNPRQTSTMTPSYSNVNRPQQGNTQAAGPLHGSAQQPVKPIVDKAEIKDLRFPQDGTKHNITWVYTRGQGKALSGDSGTGAYKQGPFSMRVKEDEPGSDPIVSMNCTYERDANGNAWLTTHSFTTEGFLTLYDQRRIPLKH